MSTLTSKRQQEIDQAISQMLLATDTSYPDDDLYKLCDRLGIKVFGVDMKILEREDVRGVIKKEDGGAVIFLNQNQTPQRRTFTLAHEIGHYILHLKDSEKFYHVDKFNYNGEPVHSQRESEANYFAASLLMPKFRLFEMMKKITNIKALASYFGVSVAAIENRLRWIDTN